MKRKRKKKMEPRSLNLWPRKLRSPKLMTMLRRSMSWKPRMKTK